MNNRQKPPEQTGKDAQIARKTDLETTCRIYFVEAVGFDLIKIGYARDIRERMRKLRPGCPAPLKLLGTEPGGAAEERAYHVLFIKHQVYGEWFRRCPEIDFVVARLDAGFPSAASPRLADPAMTAARKGLKAWLANPEDPRFETAAEIAARL